MNFLGEIESMREWMKKALYKGLPMNGGSVQGDCSELALAYIGAQLSEQEVDGDSGRSFGVAMAAVEALASGVERRRVFWRPFESWAWKPILGGLLISR
jgi:hypothetical protein